ncbi:MAG: O-antigen ligase family protein [candidate division KSB1 bacterium]|nr:O-antigen ligase family protein [candidate division KSB1 bacterium]MDZ7302959.1 O-antigen ligase family protein [candidate division KSB1 bacterium]MDZ7312235.1 O-antigen ligase family protein [candidate division KSB1 bacterium]
MTTTQKVGDDGLPIPVERRDSSWHASAWLRWLNAFSLFAFAAFVSFSIAGAHISLGLLTLCVIVQSLWRNAANMQQKHDLRIGIEWPVITFVIIILISTVLSETPLASFRNMRHLLTILGAYTVAISLRWHPEWRQPVLWTFISVATVAALYGLGKFALGFSSKVQSTQATTMTWGALCVLFMAVTLQVALAAPTPRLRWLAWAAIVPQAFAMLLSFVRGAYVGFLASAIYLLRHYWANPRLLWRRVFPVLLIFVTVIAFLAPDTVRKRIALIFDLKYHSTQVRLVQWQYALQIAADHPLFGVGWRDMMPIFRRYVPPDINVSEHVKHDIFHIGHFHSNYVMVLVCFGLAGLFAFLWLLLAVWRQLGIAATGTGSEQDRLIIWGSRAAMIGFLVAGIFDWTFGDAEVVTMFWFVIGMGLGQYRPHHQTSRQVKG